jgi:ribosomal protein L22
MLAKVFGKVQPGKDVRLKAEGKIWQMGRDLGFKAYTEYEALNLFNDGYKRFISVIWKEGNEIKAAFQVRKKKTSLYFVDSVNDKLKLDKLVSAEKYLVNVSEKTGEAVFFRVTEADNSNLWVSKDSRKIKPSYNRAYENWSEQEVKELISEYQQNLTIREIAQRHQRRRSEIRVRLSRLRLN